MKDETAARRIQAGNRMLRHVAASARAAAQSGGGYDLT